MNAEVKTYLAALAADQRSALNDLHAGLAEIASRTRPT